MKRSADEEFIDDSPQVNNFEEEEEFQNVEDEDEDLF